MYDGNGNGTIDIEDFLGILGLFGDVDSDSDGLWDSQDGCIDLEACNYETQAAGECLYPDAVGDCDGSCMYDLDGDGVCDWNVCGDPVHYHGYQYATVEIGGDCWFAENLRSENYSNGEAIASNLTDVEWENSDTGAVTVHGAGPCSTEYAPDIDACDPSQSLSEYGRIYNWYAVDDERGICPQGWHVPSDEEWMTMELALGMSEAEVNNTGWRGTNQGSQLKATDGWYNDGNGSNSSGFSGLPGGYCGTDGAFVEGGRRGYWWSSSPFGSGGWFRVLSNYYTGVQRYYWDGRSGLSVRCIQDSQ